MPKYRAILKKTRYFLKDSLVSGNGRGLKKYMTTYVDEVGKALRGSKESLAERLAMEAALSSKGLTPLEALREGGIRKTGLALNLDQPSRESEKPEDLGDTESSITKSPSPRRAKNRETVWLLPEELTGVIWAGGFFGEESSPGGNEPSKQRGWINKMASAWSKELAKNGKSRQNDGFRFILGLSPDAVSELTQAGVGVDRAMREIWRETMDLYRTRHNWQAPEDGLGWIAGAHHDTDNTHLHVVLFPTTKSGKTLKTNNARVVKTNINGMEVKERINDLNDLVAMVNIAAESFWRDNLPLRYQDVTYQKQILKDPTGPEPSLPELEDYPAETGIRGAKALGESIRMLREVAKAKSKEPTKEISEGFNAKLLAPRELEDLELAFGQRDLIAHIARERGVGAMGLQMLESYTIALRAWDDQPMSKEVVTKPTGSGKDKPKKKNLWNVIGSLEDPSLSRELVQELIATNPEANETLQELTKTLENIGIKNKGLQRLVRQWGERGKAYGRAMMSLVIGRSEKLRPEAYLNSAQKAAKAYEDLDQIGEKNPQIYRNVASMGKKLSAEAKRENSQTLSYRKLKRAITKSLDALETPREKSEKDHQEEVQEKKSRLLGIVDILIRGSKRLTLALQARASEALSAIRIEEMRIIPNIETRDFALRGGDWIAEENQGKPWPKHLDPETVISPLKGKIEILEQGGDSNEINRTSREGESLLRDLQSFDPMGEDEGILPKRTNIEDIKNAIKVNKEDDEGSQTEDKLLVPGQIAGEEDSDSSEENQKTTALTRFISSRMQRRRMRRQRWEEKLQSIKRSTPEIEIDEPGDLEIEGIEE